MVILPIVQSVGEAMPGAQHPKLLVMATGLTCSAAMGLPVRGVGLCGRGDNACEDVWEAWECSGEVTKAGLG